jgi:hypothetical protein
VRTSIRDCIILVVICTRDLDDKTGLTHPKVKVILDGERTQLVYYSASYNLNTRQPDAYVWSKEETKDPDPRAYSRTLAACFEIIEQLV